MSHFTVQKNDVIFFGITKYTYLDYILRYKKIAKGLGHECIRPTV